MKRELTILVVWYLLVPPLQLWEKRPAVVESEKPIREWKIRETFRDDKSCLIALKGLQAELKTEYRRPDRAAEPSKYDFGSLSMADADRVAREVATHARCVPSTDASRHQDGGVP
jgi:hypothetical protein